MKLAQIIHDNLQFVASIDQKEAAIFDPSTFPAVLSQWIAGGDALLTRAETALKNGQCRIVPLSEAKVLAPLTSPGKIVAIGLNYMDHCREQNMQVPDRPIVFTKFNNAIIGPGEAISWSPFTTNQVDYEVELGVVIGKAARNVSEEQALDHVYGYTIINDVSARDLQFSDKQWVRAKSMDTFCPMGPVIVTKDEIPDPQDLRLRCLLNGAIMQDSTTAEMIFPVRQLISILSQYFTFHPGDVIATGTPDGVGVFRKPPVFLKPGDEITLEIEKIGTLYNPVKGF